MSLIVSLLEKFNSYFDRLRTVDFIAPLLLRLYLAPIFILAGLNKLSALDATAYWFGEFLGLPLPYFLAILAGSVELIGGVALLIGLTVRFWTIPLMITMFVAAWTAHWENGWHVLPESTLMAPWEWREDLILEAERRKSAAVSILKEHGNYSWLTESGNFTVLKNGIEFAATYFIMCLVLLFTGAGRYFSLDFYLKKLLFRKQG